MWTFLGGEHGMLFDLRAHYISALSRSASLVWNRDLFGQRAVIDFY